MPPDEEATWLEPNHYNRLTTVVSVVSTVMTGERGRGRGYREECGKQKNHYLLHFCSINSSPMDLSRGFRLGFPTQRFKALLAATGCSKLLALAGAGIAVTERRQQEASASCGRAIDRGEPH